MVLAPGPGDTAASSSKYAAQLAARGLVAMAIDYRGWGKSGGFLYLAEPRALGRSAALLAAHRQGADPPQAAASRRRSSSTSATRSRTCRANPASTAAASASGAPISPAGTRSSIAATDFRVKAAVAQMPVIEGRDVPRKAIDAVGRAAGRDGAARAQWPGAGDRCRRGGDERSGSEARARRVPPVLVRRTRCRRRPRCCSSSPKRTRR